MGKTIAQVFQGTVQLGQVGIDCFAEEDNPKEAAEKFLKAFCEQLSETDDMASMKKALVIAKKQLKKRAQ